MKDKHEQDDASSSARRRYSKLAAAGAFAAVAGAGVLLFAVNTTASSAAADKVYVCHATGTPDTNGNGAGYIQITTDANGALAGHLSVPDSGTQLSLATGHEADIISAFTITKNVPHVGDVTYTWPGNVPANFDVTTCTTVTASSESTSASSAASSSTAASSSSAGTAPTSEVNPPVVTVTQTAAAAPIAAEIPNGVAAGQHTTASSTDAALGGLLMAVGVGGLLTVLRPWKRGSH